MLRSKVTLDTCTYGYRMVGRKLTLLFLLQLFYLTGCRCSAKNSPTPQLDGGEAKATAVRPGKAKKTKPICWPKGEGSLWNRHEAVRPKNEEEERLDLPFAAEVLAWEHRSTGSIFVGFDPATASKEAWLTALNEQGARRLIDILIPCRYWFQSLVKVVGLSPPRHRRRASFYWSRLLTKIAPRFNGLTRMFSLQKVSLSIQHSSPLGFLVFLL